LTEEHFRPLVEINGVTEDVDAGLADYIMGWFLVAFGVDEVPFVQAKDGAVGQELVQVQCRLEVRDRSLGSSGGCGPGPACLGHGL
jgi:hypothetical protein